MRVLVVDDEPLARRRLVRMLEKIDGIEVAGEAEDGEDALARIGTLDPDLVLLDIRMPGLDGLTLARETPNLPPIIFTTAYDQYAVDAFEASAVDYLLKPVKQERLERALAKVQAKPRRAPSGDDGAIARVLERLLEGRERTSAPRITAQHGDALHVFDAREIARFYAQDKYTAFQVGGREYLLEESLSSLEKRLEPFEFIRVHRGELIALDQVRSFRAEDAGGLLELKDGQTARVSRRFVASLKKALGG